MKKNIKLLYSDISVVNETLFSLIISQGTGYRQNYQPRSSWTSHGSNTTFGGTSAPSGSTGTRTASGKYNAPHILLFISKTQVENIRRDMAMACKST